MAGQVTAAQTIGDLLLREGLITHAQLENALARQKETEQPLVRILVETGILDETKRLNFFKKQFGVPMISLQSVKIDPILYTYVPAPLARKNHLVPVKLDRDGLVIAMEDPSDLLMLDNLKEIVGLRIKPVIAPSQEINEALAGYPEEKPPETPQAAGKFDPGIRMLRYFFMPVMSISMLFGIFIALAYSSSFQDWVKQQFADSATRSSQVFTLFLYFFLTWGVWTIIMYEIQGVVFDDLQWKPMDEAGEPRAQSKAMVLSLVLGFFGVDRFYLGYTLVGLIKLLTLGFFGIWWILDIIFLAGNRIPDAYGRPLM